VILSLALVATLLILVFARDISRAAHNANAPRRSENLSFAAAANALLTNENHFDQRLAYLLSNGASLSRPIFTARLTQLDNALAGWLSVARQLRRPHLAHDVNAVLYNSTTSRVAAYETLLAQITSTLQLPWRPATTFVGDPAAAQTLTTSASAWNQARFSLAREPGRARLDALSNETATKFSTSGLTALAGSTSLALVRSVTISALSVRPAALPAGPGIMLLPPVTSVHLGVSVTNQAFVSQAVTLIVRVVSRSASPAAYQEVLHATLGPLASYAFVPKLIATQSSEHATVTIRLVGAPGGAALTHVETYQLVMAPSGNG